MLAQREGRGVCEKQTLLQDCLQFHGGVEAFAGRPTMLRSRIGQSGPIALICTDTLARSGWRPRVLTVGERSRGRSQRAAATGLSVRPVASQVRPSHATLKLAKEAAKVARLG